MYHKESVPPVYGSNWIVSLTLGPRVAPSCHGSFEAIVWTNPWWHHISVCPLRCLSMEQAISGNDFFWVSEIFRFVTLVIHYLSSRNHTSKMVRGKPVCPFQKSTKIYTPNWELPIASKLHLVHFRPKRKNYFIRSKEHLRSSIEQKMKTLISNGFQSKHCKKSIMIQSSQSHLASLSTGTLPSLSCSCL